MTLAAGTRVGSYEITTPIGAGGMGEVYRARDTKLNRDVAVKVLPVAFGEDRDRVARFRREAQLAASLNHSNVGAVYGLEETNGTVALVLELVEGEDLAARLAGGALPVDEAIAIAKQIAEGLEAAHEKGIVHRDLKPANVKLTRDGTVKILDFGLAKAFEGDAASGDSGLSKSPTMSRHMTEAGMILGTAAYMSPEQARGRPVDKRSDIWSFGAVLYEMLTGRRLFEGETVTDVLAAVLRANPDFSALPAGVPAAAVRVLHQCLQRDPKLRLHDIADARIELGEAAEEPVSGPAAVAARGRAPVLPWAIAGLLLAALVGAVVTRPRPETAKKTVRFVLTPPPGGMFSSWPALTTDGTTLLYGVRSGKGDNVFWTRRLDSEDSKPLPVVLTSIRFPFWSPDGKSVAYGSEGRLVRFDLATSRPQGICAAPSIFHGAWGAHGDILLVPFYGAGIHRVSAGGGTPVPVTAVDASHGEVAHLNPQFLADGRRFLFFARLKHAGQDREGWICAASLGGKDVKKIRQADTLVGSGDGSLYFTNEGILMVQPFDESSLATRGEPAAIPGRVVHEGDTATADASIARDGTLAFRSDPPRLRQLVLVDRTGKRLKPIGSPGEFVEPVRLSPDGSRVAVGKIDERTALTNLWVLDVDGGAAVRLTSGRQEERHPVFSPDGASLAFSTDRDGPYDMVVRSLAGGADRTLLATPFDKLPYGWTREGGLFYQNSDPKGAALWQLSPEKGAKPQALGAAPWDADSAISPDGQWIAYMSSETGQSEVYARAAAAEGAKIRVSLDGGRNPRFRGDGKEVFFVGKDQMLMAAPWPPVATARRPPQPLFTMPSSALNYAPFDVSGDGEKFLISEPLETTTRTEITVVVNGVR